MTVCKRVQYSGRVQGVGFRYTVEGMAAGYPVAGWVKNLANGDVELVAEGPQSDVEAFLTAVSRRMANYIDRSEVADLAPSNLQSFGIRH
jgi:acylphosphatase